MPDPCAARAAPSTCTGAGPWLLGGNADGSLLFWKVTGTTPSASSDASGHQGTRQIVVIFYYKTWLDGTHAVRLTGELGRYGPPLAAR